MPVSTSDTQPRIRGENPPPGNVEKFRNIRNEIMASRVFAAVVFIGGIVIALIAKYFLLPSDSWLPIILILLTIAVSGFLIYFSDNRISELDKFPQLFELDAYNREFISLLADRSTLHTAIHFEMPTHLAMQVPGVPETQSTYHVEQLNRVTETLLVRFVAPMTDPPTRSEIEDHLEINLLQFQNEKRIPVLRLKVATNIHISAAKPKGVNV